MQPVAPLRWIGCGAVAAVRRRRVEQLLPVASLPLHALAPARLFTPTWQRLPVPPAEELDARTFVAEAAAVGPPARVLPQRDPDHVAWLFGELATMVGRDAEILRRVVRRRGRVVGWYVCRVQRSGAAKVLQVLCRAPDAETVLGELFATAAAHGAVVVTGRVEAHPRRPCAVIAV